MALSTYAELCASVADWLHKPNLAAQVVDFIDLAESQINTDLRLRVMQVDEPLTLASHARTIALPARYLEPIKLELAFPDRDNKKLTYLSPEQMTVNAAAGAAGEPDYWTVDGDTLEFPNLSDRAYSVTFRMLKGFDLATTSTNALLTKYPGIYLYGALLQAAPYCVDDARMATWGAMYEQLKAKINKQEGRDKKLTQLRTDHPSVQPHSNIFRG